jgi:hypothetical protein
MTSTDSAPTDQAVVDQIQVLFEEARQRRTRRWLIGGITALVLVVLLAIVGTVLATGGGGTDPDPHGSPARSAVAGTAGSSFSIRPVLCYAPPYSPAFGQAQPTGPLPTCSASSQLTPSSLNVTPANDNVNGFTADSNVLPDPKFANYPSTPKSGLDPKATVLLPGTRIEGSSRYVLGPAGFTRSGVASAQATEQSGQWLIELTLTQRGSAQWDALAAEQFHAILGIVINGQVVSAPITQPTQSSFTSFHGQLSIGGSFTEHQAKAIATEL